MPAGPTKGRPARSSTSPGCSPTSMSRPESPSPNTVCVARSYRSTARTRSPPVGGGVAGSRSRDRTSWLADGGRHGASVRSPRSPIGVRSRRSARAERARDVVLRAVRGVLQEPLRDRLDLLQGLLLLLQVLLQQLDRLALAQRACLADEARCTRRSRSAPRVRLPRSGRRRASSRSVVVVLHELVVLLLDALDARARRRLRALAELREDLARDWRTCFSVSLRCEVKARESSPSLASSASFGKTFVRVFSA